MTMKKVFRTVLALISLMGLGLLLLTVGGIESDMIGIQIGRILGAMAFFLIPLGILGLTERR